MQRNKAFTAINVLGLALGIACSLLISLWVSAEFRIDTFHQNNPQLYSVFERQYHDGTVFANHNTPGLLAKELKKTYPEVKLATGYAWNNKSTFEANNKIIKEDGNYAGEDFFAMFSFPLLKGRPETALKEPLSLAISKKMAEDFFGSAEKAYGQTIRFQNKKDFTVTAVFDNVPSGSSLKFDFLLNWEEFLHENEWAKDWGNNAPATYLLLREGTDAKAFAKKITNFIENYFREPNFKVRLDLQPFGDVYLHSNFKDGEFSGGRIESVRLFGIIAIFILLIACINFMNLTTARSARRAKEIGIRKVVGAFRLALVRQFIGEALFYAFLAAVMALVFVVLAMQPFNELTHKQMSVPFADPRFLLGFAALVLVTGVVSGSYPAMYLSSFNSISVLKGTVRFGTGALWFRKGLVVFQFALSIVLIIGTIVVSRQIDYIQRTNLGYDRENLLYVPLEGDLLKNYVLFKNKAVNVPGIQEVSRITDNPTNISNATGGVQWEGKDPTSMVQFAQAAVGYDFTKTLKVPVVKGRDFSKNFPTDSAGYLINETAQQLIGFNDPVGKTLVFWQKPGTIIGVMKDCHFSSLHDPIRPLVLRLGETEGYGHALVRTERGKTKEALASLERIAKELNPKFPFTYSFSDEDYQRLYTSEKLVGKLSNAFAFLAIFISCLGLLGLAMFTAEQRTKEFGIRKVLGASVTSLFHLLSKEFIFLVLLALVIASPLAWYFMHNWLLDYAYRVNLSWWMFAAAGLAALAIALLTVSFQAIKAAFVNPVKSLRTE